VNCPKYLNKKQIISSLPEPTLASNSLPIPDLGVMLLAKADLFFLSSSNHESNMSTNHRGGPPGFVRIVNNDTSGTTLAYPEYSGNRLYQTLGNLQTTPKAGLVFPNFDNGDVLYLTGTTEILIGKEAATLLPRSNLAVKVKIDAARFVRKGLSFRGTSGDFSPYNPPVRFLRSERALPDLQATNKDVAYAKLLTKDLITPTIARLRFSVSDPEAAGRWKPGQYVALAFEDELDAGYSHMRDDDPRSINDDYVRTFTVSSPAGGTLSPDEFEITFRNVGVVTNFLFRQQVRAGLEVPLRGFGGNFAIAQAGGEIVPFVAGGIGITPLLSQIPDLDLDSLHLFWTINIRDIGLASDTLDRYPFLAASTKIFVSGVADAATEETKAILDSVRLLGCQILPRRMLPRDVQENQNIYAKWYVCTGTELRKSLLSWLANKEVLYEDFNY
jgi:NAD(P)H-flavin reductase